MSDSTSNRPAQLPQLAEHNILATYRDEAAAREAADNLAARGIAQGVFLLPEASGAPAELGDSPAWRLVTDAVAEGRVVVGVSTADEQVAEVADEVLRAEGVGNIQRFDASGNPRM